MPYEAIAKEFEISALTLGTRRQNWELQSAKEHFAVHKPQEGYTEEQFKEIHLNEKFSRLAKIESK